MNPKIKRLTGLVILVVAWVWIGVAQVVIWKLPTMTASEAPSRHLRPGDTFTRYQAYELAFGLARDLRDRGPNILFPATLLFAGAWLFFSSPPIQGRPKSTPNDRNA